MAKSFALFLCMKRNEFCAVLRYFFARFCAIFLRNLRITGNIFLRKLRIKRNFSFTQFILRNLRKTASFTQNVIF